MPIAVKCPCGFGTKVKDEFAGRRTKCPQCAITIVVPRPEPRVLETGEIRLLDDEPAPAKAPANPVRATLKAPRPAAKEPEVIEDFEVVDDDEAPTPPPSARPKRKPAGPDKPIVLDLNQKEKKSGADRKEVEEEKPPPKRKKRRRPRPVGYENEERPPLIALSPAVAGALGLIFFGSIWLIYSISYGWFNYRAAIAIGIGVIILGRGLLGLEEE